LPRARVWPPIAHPVGRRGLAARGPLEQASAEQAAAEPERASLQHVEAVQSKYNLNDTISSFLIANLQ